MPGWLPTLSAIYVPLSLLSGALVLADIFLLGRRQHMWIMEAVWPLTILYWGPAGLLGMFAWMAFRTWLLPGLHPASWTYWFMIADRDAGGLRDHLSGELLADPSRHEGSDVGVTCRRAVPEPRSAIAGGGIAGSVNRAVKPKTSRAGWLQHEAILL